MDNDNGTLTNGCAVSTEMLSMLRSTYLLAQDTHSLLSTVTLAQTSMSNAATSMATTNAKAEERYAKLEDRLQDANDKAAGKAQIPLTSHLIILGSTVLLVVLVVLYVTHQTIDATVTSLKVHQNS